MIGSVGPGPCIMGVWGGATYMFVKCQPVDVSMCMTGVTKIKAHGLCMAVTLLQHNESDNDCTE
jgi:hypothetical protein